MHDNLTLSARRQEVELRVGVEAAVELSLPGGPVTARQGVLTLRPGREVELVCSAEAGFPTPQVEFSGPAGLAVTTAATRPADSVGHTWSAEATARFTPRPTSFQKCITQTQSAVRAEKWIFYFPTIFILSM